MTAALHAWRAHSEAYRWSLVAVALAAVGLVASIWVILGSDTDTSQVRWWLVVTPLLVTAAPVVLPQHVVRVAAMITLAAWCAVTGFSIGIFLVPALIASAVSLVREGRS